MKYLLFVTFLTLSFLLSCTSEELNTKIKITTCADNPPFEFVQDGKVVGFDIDLVTEIARKLEKQADVQNVDFTGVILSLVTGRAEIAIAALSPTEARAKNVDFTIPYFDTDMAVIYRNDTKIESIADFASKTIGAQFGTTWAQYAAEIAKDQSLASSVRTLPDNLALVRELINKNVDVVIMEQYQATKFSSEQKGVNLLILPNTNTKFAIAVKKDSALTIQISKIIEELYENGFIESLKNKWF